MKYRSEIDGLRAIAVLPVIFFHAGASVFSGGYVGVDIFFVISGYLITTIILAERAAGVFSIRRFYERRARRILPALYLVIFACLPFAWAWMVPEMLADFARSVAATALFISNAHFWETAGYFAADTDLKPLLHTWSLAVEEQFYLVFPLFLILTGTRKLGRFALLLAILALASLLLSEWGWRNEPDANFYFTLSRFWELLAGSLCGILLFGRDPYSNNALAALGLGLISFAVFAFDETVPFPSVYALVPVMGSVLIILFAAPRTVVAKLLSLKPFVGIGLISYSAYLWHQPLFAFARIRSPQEPAMVWMMLLSAMTLGLAYLSWRFVEQPFRRRDRQLLPTQKSVFAVSGAGMAVLVCVGVLVMQSGGAPLRTAPNGIRYSDFLSDEKLAFNIGLDRACVKSLESAITSPACRTSDNPSVLLWGDSYAMHLAKWLEYSDSAADVGVQQVTKGACWPILGVAGRELSPAQARECVEFNDAVLEWISKQANISTVILSSPFHTAGEVIDRTGKTIDNSDDTYGLAHILSTIESLRALKKRVVIVSPPPNSGSDIGDCLLYAILWDEDLSRCDFTTQDYTDARIKSYRLLDKVGKDVPVILLDKIMCREGNCAASDGDVFLYRDHGHLSVESAQSLGRKIDLLELTLAKAN